jgi:hypothetical protein
VPTASRRTSRSDIRHSALPLSHVEQKRAKPARTAAIGAGQAGSPDPAELAGTALAAARYRDAIELFKELLKREWRPAWLNGVAAAYAGRAERLAAKDMIKKALALWRTRARGFASCRCWIGILESRRTEGQRDATQHLDRRCDGPLRAGQAGPGTQPPLQRAAHSMPRSNSVRICGTWNSAATCPSAL